jgi:catechol 2,3-dioxygenase-like lactoylglutathione lyase family enzyme
LRFDHGVIAVSNLEPAIRIYRDVLGLDARHGGRHAGRGTENAIIRFPDTYLELLSLHDAEKEIASAGLRGQVLADFIRNREGGLVGYGLGTSEVFRRTEELRRAGLEAPEPRLVSRKLPSGSLLKWHVMLPGGVNWRRPWPFLIQGDPANADCAAEEPPGNHPLGVTEVTGVSVIVANLERGRDLYGRQFGLVLSGEDQVPELGAARARYALGDLSVDVLAPAGPGLVRTELDSVGEGTFELLLRVADMQAAAGWLARSQITLQPAPGYPKGRLIPPDRAVGARLILTT